MGKNLPRIDSNTDRGLLWRGRAGILKVISKIKMLNFGSKSRKKLDEALKKESRPKERAFKTMPKKETQIEQNDAPCEMAEGPSEQRAQQLIAEFALEDITERRVLEFLRRMLDCCDFTTNPCTNLRMLGRLVTSHPVLAAKSFKREQQSTLLYVASCFVARAGDAGVGRCQGDLRGNSQFHSPAVV